MPQYPEAPCLLLEELESRLLFSRTTTPLDLSALQGAVNAFAWSGPAQPNANFAGLIWATTSTTPEQIAAATLTQPAGHAAVFFWWTLIDGLIGDPLDHCRTADGQLTAYMSPWLDHGTAMVGPRIDRFMSDFVAAGGQMDYLVTDYEVNLLYWALSSENILAISQDPRFTALAPALGPYTANDVVQGNMAAVIRWNAVMIDVVNHGLDAAVFGVVQQYFPDVRASNYYSAVWSPENVTPDPNGHYQYTYSYAGSVQAPPFYGGIGNLAYQVLPGTTQPYGTTAFAALRWETNSLRAVFRSNAAPIDAWISAPSNAGSLTNTPYYTEKLYHLALSGVQDFLYWNPNATAADDAVVSQALTVLNSMFGSKLRTVRSSAALAWDSPLVTSAMQLGAKQILYRVTAPPGVTRVRIDQTGRILSLDGGVGLWYTSSARQLLTFSAS